ncbi:MAG: HD-GYP domain-containing protein [Telluria sp.]
METEAGSVACSGGAGEAPLPVLRALNQACRRLERVLAEPSSFPAPDTELRALADAVISAVERQPDIALAAVYLNQIAGTYMVRHCVETAIVCVLLARALAATPDEVTAVAAAALTMNIGMLRQPERFGASDGPLSADERAALARHPQEGVELLRAAGIEDPRWLDYVLLHHATEADAPGMPRLARLIGVADRYCACVSARNYRRSLTPLAALALLQQQAPAQDAPLLEAFAQKIGRHPPGALVRLANEEVGVVTRRLEGDAVQVRVLRDAAGLPLAEARLCSSSEAGCAVAAPLHEDEAGVRFSMKQVWGEQAAL